MSFLIPDAKDLFIGWNHKGIVNRQLIAAYAHWPALLTKLLHSNYCSSDESLLIAVQKMSLQS
jgi:hypothetical protein